jgi:uncharacterized membrane protein
MLLACFRGANSAAKARRHLDKQIAGAGDTILDQVVLHVDAKRRVRVYDPRRVLAGTLTAGLTWGVFGLLTGGVASGGLWAIIGAVCGGLYAYYSEHLLTKDELKRIGGRLPPDSSVLVDFIQASNGERVLAAAKANQLAEASVAVIGADLSARVLAGAAMPVESSSAPAGGGPLPLNSGTALSMLLMRYRQPGTARRELTRNRPAGDKHRQVVQTEMIFEAPDHGRLKVTDPSALGAWGFAKSDLVSWGLFGVVYGLIVGLVHNHGIFSAVKVTAAAGVICAVFGLAAGALYGLWAGRGVSARRLKGLRALLPPGTSTVLAWSEENLTQQVIDDWSEPGSERLVVRFNPAADGVLLEV